MRRPVSDDLRRQEIVRDSEALGVAEAARKHGVSDRTVNRYRASVGVEVRPSSPSSRKRVVAFVGMRHEYAKALLALLKRLLVLAEASDNLFHVAGALKVVSDAHTATEILDALESGTDALPGSTPAVSAHTDAQRRVISLFGGRRTPRPPDDVS